MTCLVTTYRLHLNSSDYRDSCFVKWFMASFCIASYGWANPGTIVPYTCIRIVYGCFNVSCVTTQKLALNHVTQQPSLVWGIQFLVVTCDQARHGTRQYSNQTRKWLIVVFVILSVDFNSSAFYLYNIGEITRLHYMILCRKISFKSDY